MSSTDTKVLLDEFFRDPSKFFHYNNNYHHHHHQNPQHNKHQHQQRSTVITAVGDPKDPKSPPRLLTSSGKADAPSRGNANRFEVLNLIKLCREENNIEKVRKIHEDVVLKDTSIAKDIRIATALITTYAKCGALKEAREVFEQLLVHDVVSWSALISAYAQNGCGDEALECFQQMRDAGISPDRVTYICILKACGLVKSLEIGQEIDANIRNQGLLQKDVVLGNALVHMYCKCGSLEKAKEVFEQLPQRNVVTWSAMITGYCQHGLGDQALACFREMQNAGIRPDAVTYVCILKACGILGSLEVGEDIDVEVRKQGLLQKNVVLGTALVDMYAKCGAQEKAREVFEQLPERNLVSWNALISGYAQNGLGDEALKCFKQMQDARILPDAVTYVCILKACAIVGSLDIGKDIDVEVRKRGLLRKNIVLGTALVDMYSKCGELEKAHEVFEKLPEKNVVSWNALINGYAQNGHGEEALKCFWQMQDARIRPDVVTYIGVLKGCGIVGSLDIGGDIDAEVRKQGLFQENLVLGTAVVDMYTKCGALEEAREVFEELSERNAVVWNALIAGYAQLGQVNVVLELYRCMREEDVAPDLVTFLVLLTACSHAGLVKEGEKWFDEMSYAYCLDPTLKHYTCMIDLFGRAGHFDKAKAVLEKVPHAALFLSLLNACRKWRNVNLGRWAFEQLVQLDQNCATAYVCMGNIYAAAGMQTEALRVRSKAWKTGRQCWWSDSNGKVHSFVVADKNHPQSIQIYAKLQEINQKLPEHGYSESLHWGSRVTLDDKKENVVCGHTERLAIACALINTREGVPIHVTKNTRICADCHSTTCLVSLIEKRVIQVKDANCVHSFVNGKCVCDDFQQ